MSQALLMKRRRHNEVHLLTFFFRELRVSGNAHLLRRWETADRTIPGFRQRHLHMRCFQRGGQGTQELPPHRSWYVHVSSSTVY